MTNYKFGSLKSIVKPNIAAQISKKERQSVLDKVRERRKIIYRRFLKNSL